MLWGETPKDSEEVGRWFFEAELWIERLPGGRMKKARTGNYCSGQVLVQFARLLGSGSANSERAGEYE